MPSNTEMVEIHKELLILLKTFHKICINNQIKYSLHGGSLLGAIREKGFIPWDDDADITIARSEYVKLENILRKTNLGEEIHFSTDMRLTPMLWIKRRDKPAAWLSLFIYDYISENKTAQKLKIAMLIAILKSTHTKREMKISWRIGGKPVWQYPLAYLAYGIGKFFPMSAKVNFANWIGKNVFVGKRKLVHRSNDQRVGMILILPRNIIESYEMVSFEDTELMVSMHYHEILVNCYGVDYLIPKKMAHAKIESHDTIRGLFA